MCGAVSFDGQHAHLAGFGVRRESSVTTLDKSAGQVLAMAKLSLVGVASLPRPPFDTGQWPHILVFPSALELLDAVEPRHSASMVLGVKRLLICIFY